MGFIAIATGFALRILVARRRFYRRNAAGVELFDGYWNAFWSNAIESVISGVGRLLVIGGIGWLIFAAFWRPEAAEPTAPHRARSASSALQPSKTAPRAGPTRPSRTLAASERLEHPRAVSDR